MSTFNIIIENCNTIERADVAIEKGKLNIKYGPNGIGKSTIAKAILAATEGTDALAALVPFKHRASKDKISPSVIGADEIKSVLLFDERYVSQFVFQPDEVVRNSFDIFINTDEYKAAMLEIDALLTGIKDTFKSNDELESAISDLKELREAFGLTKSGAISKSSKGFKAFGGGNKIANIPPALSAYTDFIQSEQPSKWISWQSKGNEFLELSENCPYCSSSLAEQAQKDTAQLVAKEYDSKAVEHLNALQAVIMRLGQYFSTDCRASLDTITKSKIELSPEEVNFLASLSGDIETLLGKLEALRSISFFSLQNTEKLEEDIERLRVDLTLLKNLTSDATKSVIDPINDRLSELAKEVGILKGKIAKHKGKIARTIAENETEINGFLKSAGYKYFVDIKPDGESYKMKMIHQDYSEHLEAASEHLSYGERNAFALVLFMHQVLREKPDLAILDDPVSSFDKTKKFAIFHQLFRGKGSLRDVTTLMLTHDLEPAIDIVKVSRRDWNNSHSQLPSAFFLTSNRSTVSEKEITPSDIKTFGEICRENITCLNDDIIKCIYLRRYYEIIGVKDVEYNLLSSLLHGRGDPTIQDSDGSRSMTEEEIREATAKIQREFSEFDYTTILSAVCDLNELKSRFDATSVGYEKLQIYRIAREVGSQVGAATEDDDVLSKFINESFHIENEYVMQLNPHSFDNVPDHIISECSSNIHGLVP